MIPITDFFNMIKNIRNVFNTAFKIYFSSHIIYCLGNELSSSFFFVFEKIMTHCTIIWFNMSYMQVKYDFSVPLSFINEHVIVAIDNVGKNPKKSNSIW